MSDPLADLLGQIERETFGTSMGPDTLKRWAAALCANRDRLLEALGSEKTSHMVVTTPGMSGSRWIEKLRGDVRHHVKSMWPSPFEEDQT